jgi:hypothetical protein
MTDDTPPILPQPDPNQWHWEYIHATGRWYFHAKDYTPEVSVIVERHASRPGWITVKRNIKTTMPEEVFRILEKMSFTLDLYQEARDGITRINVPKDKVLQGAKGLKFLTEKHAKEKKNGRNIQAAG